MQRIKGRRVNKPKILILCAILQLPTSSPIPVPSPSPEHSMQEHIWIHKTLRIFIKTFLFNLERCSLKNEHAALGKSGKENNLSMEIFNYLTRTSAQMWKMTKFPNTLCDIRLCAWRGREKAKTKHRGTHSRVSRADCMRWLILLGRQSPNLYSAPVQNISTKHICPQAGKLDRKQSSDSKQELQLGNKSFFKIKSQLKTFIIYYIK